MVALIRRPLDTVMCVVYSLVEFLLTRTSVDVLTGAYTKSRVAALST